MCHRLSFSFIVSCFVFAGKERFSGQFIKRLTKVSCCPYFQKAFSVLDSRERATFCLREAGRSVESIEEVFLLCPPPFFCSLFPFCVGGHLSLLCPSSAFATRRKEENSLGSWAEHRFGPVRRSVRSFLLRFSLSISLCSTGFLRCFSSFVSVPL